MFRLPDALWSALKGRMDSEETKNFVIDAVDVLRDTHKVDLISRLVDNLGFKLLVSGGRFYGFGGEKGKKISNLIASRVVV